MNIEKTAGQPKNRYYHPSIERLRIVLMCLLCIYLFGFPTSLNNLPLIIFAGFTEDFCKFVPLAFFILSGYLVLRESPNRRKRIARTIARTAVVFAALAVSYFIINYFYYRRLGVDIFASFTSPQFYFNFLVMNIWQFGIGDAIWYVQALLYAYIIIYFLDRWNLLKFDWLIAALLLLLTVLSGEFAGLVKWNVGGYAYIPGNFFTRALPYILIGAFIHRRMDLFGSVKKGWYFNTLIVGIVLIVAEPYILDTAGVPGYYEHLLGHGVIAVSICMFAFLGNDNPGFETELKMSRWHVNCIYYLYQPVSVGIVFLLSVLGEGIVADAIMYISIPTFIISFFLAWLIAYIDRTVLAKFHG